MPEICESAKHKFKDCFGPPFWRPCDLLQNEPMAKVCNSDVIFRRELFGALVRVDAALLEDFRPTVNFCEFTGREFCAAL